MMDRIYFDSAVLLRWLLGEGHSTKGVASSFIDGVSNEKYEGIISQLTILEMIKVIRNLLVEKGKTDPKEWADFIFKAIDSIYKIPKIRIIEGTVKETGEKHTVTSSDHMSFGKISYDAVELIKKYQGKTKSSTDGKKLEHDGISAVDALHVILAKRLKCNKIVSFDNDFDQLSGEIQPIILGRK